MIRFYYEISRDRAFVYRIGAILIDNERKSNWVNVYVTTPKLPTYYSIFGDPVVEQGFIKVRMCTGAPGEMFFCSTGRKYP